MDRRVIVEASFPHAAATQLIQDTLWGSDAGVRYQVKEPVQHEFLGHHRLFLLHRSERLAGCVVVTERPEGWLAQLLAVHPDFRRTGVAESLMQHATSVVEGPLYGTVESTNQRSLNLSEKGRACRRDLEVLTFSRRWPRPSSRCQQNTEAWREGLPTAGRIGEMTEVDPSWAFTIDGPNGSAGVLLVPHTWRLVSLPGLQRGLLPCLPLLLGTTAEDYRFGMFHGWWGDPALYDELWSHALHHRQLTSALATGDRSSALWQQLRATLRRGLVGRLAGMQGLAVVSTEPIEGVLSFTPIHAL